MALYGPHVGTPCSPQIRGAQPNSERPVSPRDGQGPHGSRGVSQCPDPSHHPFKRQHEMAQNTTSNPTLIPGRFGDSGTVPLVPTSLLPSPCLGSSCPPGSSTPAKKKVKSKKKWFFLFFSELGPVKPFR